MLVIIVPMECHSNKSANPIPVSHLVERPTTWRCSGPLGRRRHHTARRWLSRRRSISTPLCRVIASCLPPPPHPSQQQQQRQQPARQQTAWLPYTIIGLHISRVGVGRSPLLERSSYFCIASFLLWWRRCLRNRHRGNRSMLRSAWISGQTNVAAASEHNSLPATTTQHTVRVFMFDFRPFDMKLCRQDQITGLSGTTSACWRRTAATFAYWNDQRSQYWQSVFM